MTRATELTLWLAALLFVLGGAVTWRAAVSIAGSLPSSPIPSMDSAAPIAEAGVVSARASAVVARNPFRLDRKPSNVPFGVVPAVVAEPARRPPLVLTGVFGPPWQAVLEGVPGRQGSVIAGQGDMLGNLEVRSIHRDTVVVVGPDTTWKLTVRRAW